MFVRIVVLVIVVIIIIIIFNRNVNRQPTINNISCQGVLPASRSFLRQLAGLDDDRRARAGHLRLHQASDKQMHSRTDEKRLRRTGKPQRCGFVLGRGKMIRLVSSRAQLGFSPPFSYAYTY